MPRRVINGNMVYLAPDQSTGQTEASATASGQGATEAPAETPEGINVAAVADKVYRLMQRELVLESERVTRLGG